MSTTSLPSQVEVLVVGAGPVGLAAAITLTQLGVNVAIVDKDITNRNGSRAAVVHSRTLEVLETIGMSQPIIDEGIQTTKITLYGSTNTLFGINLDVLKGDTAYPFSVLISQEHVEDLLRQKLKEIGLQVIINKSATNYSYDEAAKAIDVAFDDGSSIKTQYLIGTDGAHSLVRTYSQIGFADPYSGLSYDDKSAPSKSFSIALADVCLEEPLPRKFNKGSPSTHVDKNFMYLPLPSTHDEYPGLMWRIAFGYPTTGAGIIPHAPDIDFLQDQMDKRNPWPERIVIKKVFASSRYRVRAALADTFWAKVGNGDLLLAGDASHVHSPVGGQGMNLGLCDAVSLGQSIHAHLVAKRAGSPLGEADEILRRYAEERRAIAYNVIGLTKQLTRGVNAGVGWRRIVRDWALRILGWLPGVNRKICWRISGLANRP